MEAQKIAQIPWYDWRKVLANELYVDGGVVKTRPTTKDAKE